MTNSWWWWIVFAEWLTEERCLHLISSQDHCLEILIIANSWYAASRVWTCAKPEFRLYWMKLCSNKKMPIPHYLVIVIYIIGSPLNTTHPKNICFTHYCWLKKKMYLHRKGYFHSTIAMHALRIGLLTVKQNKALFGRRFCPTFAAVFFLVAVPPL